MGDDRGHDMNRSGWEQNQANSAVGDGKDPVHGGMRFRLHDPVEGTWDRACAQREQVGAYMSTRVEARVSDLELHLAPLWFGER